MPSQQQTTNTQENKRIVKEFYEMAFNAKKPEEAVKRHIGNRYRQHNPMAPDGPDAFIAFVKGFAGAHPDLHIDIKRIIAEGDLVVTHGLITRNKDDRGIAAFDMFRIENGKIVEHWDVLQDVPEKAANENTMF